MNANANTNINALLQDFAYGAKQIFDTQLVDIILFGSYANGNNDEESDIDIAILADIPREAVNTYTDAIVSLVSKIDRAYEYIVLLSPILISKNFFDEWNEVIPFYRTLKTEGVRIDVM